MQQPRFEPIELQQIHTTIVKLMAETAMLNAKAGRRCSEKLHLMVIAGLIGVLGTTTGCVLALWLKS